MLQTTTQSSLSKNEQRMTMIGIGKHTRNILIAVGKIEDAISLIAETIEDVFGASKADSTMVTALDNTADLRNNIY